MKLTLRPNANGVTLVDDKPYYEYIEIAHGGEERPWAMIHVYAFWTRDDPDLHNRLVAGETVTVELVIAE